MRRLALLTMLGSLATSTPAAATATPIQVYGAWHCSNDACLRGNVGDIAEFDSNNHWLIDRSDGRPSVNMVIRMRHRDKRFRNLTRRARPRGAVPVGTPRILTLLPPGFGP
jgi:hypothetical protein